MCLSIWKCHESAGCYMAIQNGRMAELQDVENALDPFCHSAILQLVSDVQFLGLVSALHDEAEPGGCILAHQLVDDAVGDDLVGHVDA
jgi:hypothetical protein